MWGKAGQVRRGKAGQVRYWQCGQAEKSPDSDPSRFLAQYRTRPASQYRVPLPNIGPVPLPNIASRFPISDPSRFLAPLVGTGRTTPPLVRLTIMTQAGATSDRAKATRAEGEHLSMARRNRAWDGNRDVISLPRS